jgi:hypothetical protein
MRPNRTLLSVVATLALFTAEASAQNFVAWFAPSESRVMRDAAPSQGHRERSLAAARNEVEACQLVLASDQLVQSVAVSVSPLDGPDGRPSPAPRISVCPTMPRWTRSTRRTATSASFASGTIVPFPKSCPLRELKVVEEYTSVDTVTTSPYWLASRRQNNWGRHSQKANPLLGAPRNDPVSGIVSAVPSNVPARNPGRSRPQSGQTERQRSPIKATYLDTPFTVTTVGG